MAFTITNSLYAIGNYTHPLHAIDHTCHRHKKKSPICHPVAQKGWIIFFQWQGGNRHRWLHLPVKKDLEECMICSCVQGDVKKDFELLAQYIQFLKFLNILLPSSLSHIVFVITLADFRACWYHRLWGCKEQYFTIIAPWRMPVYFKPFLHNVYPIPLKIYQNCYAFAGTGFDWYWDYVSPTWFIISAHIYSTFSYDLITL